MKIIFWARYSKYNFDSFNHRTTMKLEFLREAITERQLSRSLLQTMFAYLEYYSTRQYFTTFPHNENWRGLKMRRPVKSFWRNSNFDNPCFLMSSTKQLSKRGFVLKWVNVVFVWTRYLKILALCLGRSSTAHSLY